MEGRHRRGLTLPVEDWLSAFPLPTLRLPAFPLKGSMPDEVPLNPRVSKVQALGLVLTAITVVQFGAAIAKEIIPVAGPLGTVLVRLGFASAVLLGIARPSFRGHSRADWGYLIAFGMALAAMNSTYYSALQYLPIGVTVTIEFWGPLAVAIAGSRRRLDAVWVLLAAAGILILSPLSGAEINTRGMILALAAGGFWALYILLSREVGARFQGLGGLGIAMLVATMLMAGPGLVSAGSSLLSWKVIGIGFLVAMMSSAIPYGLEMHALRSISAASFGLLMSLEPMVGALADSLLNGVHLVGREYLAMALILLANVGSLRSKSRAAPEAAILTPG